MTLDYSLNIYIAFYIGFYQINQALLKSRGISSRDTCECSMVLTMGHLVFCHLAPNCSHDDQELTDIAVACATYRRDNLV